MKVREIMTNRTCQISSSAMLGEAVDRMRALDTDILPVVEDRRIVGTVSEQEVAARSVSAPVDPTTTPIKDAMTPGAVCCTQEDDVEVAAHLMETHHARRLIVLDSCGAAVGVVTAEDLASKVGEHSYTGSLEGEKP